MIEINRFTFLVCLAALIPVAQSRAADEVAGELTVFNDNGAWSWFEDERVIIDYRRGKILLSSVANSRGPRGVSRSGDVDVVSYDLSSRTTQRFTLSANLQEDDHDSAALLILPDGRYLASYSKHAGDNFLRYRVSLRPGDITAWNPGETFFTSGRTTYSNLYYLSKSNTIFDFHRDGGRGFDPNYLRWDLGSASRFSYGGHLLTGPEGNTGNKDRPYLRYASNGIDRIHFITTDHHPRNLVSNSVYHGYIKLEHNGYGVYRSDGTRLGDLGTSTTSPYKASDFTPLIEGATISPTNGLRMTRGWTTDIELDSSGNPYVLFTARVNDSDRDHRFFYGRYTRRAWSIHELAKAGGCLYSPENDYTGLAALDPNDPDHVYISTNVDPRTQRALRHYEIFEGRTADGSTSWTWFPITCESSVDNLRPVVPPGARASTVILWMRGTYNSYTSYNTRIVGLAKRDPTEKIAVASKPIRSRSEAIMNMKKLLFPTDFSSYNEAAFHYAQRLAAESGALLYVAHVDELSDVNPEMVETTFLYASALGGDDRRKVRERLRGIKPTVDGVVCKHHYLRGLPAEEILQFAKQQEIDLIVMGSHGRTGLSRFLMGSVAEAVMRQATCPVLVVKQPAAGQEPTCENRKNTVHS